MSTMSSANNITPSIFDNSGLAAIKRQARGNDPAALKAAAQQFEALFLQMVLKSMRDATPKEGLFDSDQTRLYQALLDQQMSQVLAAKGGKGGTGLAALIESQLSRNGSGATAADPEVASPAAFAPIVAPVAAPAIAPANSSGGTPTAEPSAASRSFVDNMWPYAVDASRTTGIPPQFMLAQAALETGWGRSEPRTADGKLSYNLFGIKAGSNWSGATVEATTTEFIGGRAQQRVERFRAYGSYAESFADYANLLASNPRYSAALGSTDASTFASSLSRAGYATDPAYAEKLTRIIGSLPASSSLAA
jgi:flagellar protein FlgJ